MWLSDFNQKIVPMNFTLKDYSGKQVHLRAEAYLLDDNLEKEKFFVAFKFSDISNHIWFKTRISMSCTIIQQNFPAGMKEWLILEQALESAVPVINLRDADPDLLAKHLGADDSKCLQGPILPDRIQIEHAETKRKVQLNIIKYFLAKVCLVDKAVGHAFGMLTAERKKLMQLGLYFRERFGGKMRAMRSQILQTKPVPWSALQLIQKKWWHRSEPSPVDGTFSSLGIYSGLFQTSDIHHQDLSQNSLDLAPVKVSEPSTMLFSAARAVLRFKKLVDPKTKGWNSIKYLAEDGIVCNVVSRVFTIVLFHNKYYWINTVELQFSEPREFSESDERDLVNEFKVRIHQTKLPSKNQRPISLDISLVQLPSILGIKMRELLRIIGTLFCKRRLSQTTHKMFTKTLTEFLKSRILMFQAVKNTLTLGRTHKLQVREELTSVTNQNLHKKLRAGRTSLLLPDLLSNSDDWTGEPRFHRAGFSSIKVVTRTGQVPTQSNAFVATDYDREWYIARTINYRVRLFAEGLSTYSVDRRMQNSIRMKYEFHMDPSGENDYVLLRIYDYLGQKGLTIKVADRAKFEQILPIIFHPNENFRLIMTNFMFAMKKRELMFSGYKSFRREDIYLGAHYSAELREVKRSLLFDTYNGYLKILNKMETVFVSVIEHLGTCIVRAETYFNWHSGDSSKRNRVFVKFVAVPHKSRLATHKLVLREKDFVNLIGIEPYKFLGNEKVLISIFLRVFKLLRVENRGLYKSLIFPGIWVSPQAPFSRILSKKNQNSSLFFKETEDFVEELIYSRTLVCKAITKIHGRFAILIVRRSVIDGLVTIEAYMPQLRRNLYTSLYLNGSSTKNSHYPNLEKVLLENLKSAQSGIQIQQSGSYSKLPEVKSYQQYQSLLIPVLDNQSHAMNLSIMKHHDLSMTIGMDVTLGGQLHLPTQSDINATVLSASVADKFQIQLYWELLLNHIDIEERPRSKLVMRIGTRTVNLLKEVVFYKEVIIAERLVCFQVTAEGRDPRKAIEPLEILQYQNLRGLQYFVKIGITRGIKSTSKNNTTFDTTEKSDKISFVKAVELLHLNISREQPINIWKIREVAFLICKHLHDIIMVKAKTSVQLKEFILQHRLSDLLAPASEGNSPLHSRLCQETQSSENESFEKLYKSTLVLQIPLHAEIHLSNQRQEVMFLLFNSRLRDVWSWRLEVKEICELIPHFWELHYLKEYSELGERLLWNYKNKLLLLYHRESRHLSP